MKELYKGPGRQSSLDVGNHGLSSWQESSNTDLKNNQVTKCKATDSYFYWVWGKTGVQ